MGKTLTDGHFLWHFRKKNSHFNVIQIKCRILLELLKKLNKYNLQAI